MNEHWLAVLYRWFGGSILCFFAFIPAWIGGGTLINLIHNPDELDWFVIGILAGRSK